MKFPPGVASLLSIVLTTATFFASAQRGFHYYTDSSKVGSTNKRAFSYFKQAYYNHIWTWSKSGADSAEYYLKLALQEDSLYGATYAFLGHVYQFKTYDQVDFFKKLALQKKYAEKAMRLQPKSGDAYSLLSDVKWHERDTAEAFLLLRKAIQMDPDHVGNYIWLAVRFSQLPTGKNSAIFYLHQLIKLDPEYGQAYMKLANLYLESNHLDSAAFYYQKTIQHYNQVKLRDNRMMAGYFGLANVLLKERQYDSAFYYYTTYYRALVPTDYITKEAMLTLVFAGLYESYTALMHTNQGAFINVSKKHLPTNHPSAFLFRGIVSGLRSQYGYAIGHVPALAISFSLLNYTYTTYALTQLLETTPQPSSTGRGLLVDAVRSSKIYHSDHVNDVVPIGCIPYLQQVL